MLSTDGTITGQGKILLPEGQRSLWKELYFLGSVYIFISALRNGLAGWVHAGQRVQSCLEVKPAVSSSVEDPRGSSSQEMLA